ncbi:sulfatase-like hydrolase/transferase [Bacteroides helcogenes]|uniref:Sulfatase n=1 Tax=Bacteroides helcogenes (strain ATCC 35417 / DSM 20613 / JCM 6297 / CCUG 15421 / P 36-108) TaxID=693979 RepID=E6SRX0_BACT6|nr:sulfatase-like hydrolase/transferase [Bacteroides helcogenes]ADV42129.1 sulfatase [Bacteroides helcogenes P 36-108]MDY5240076.1 sulfatase-like hydrolase/transferase [Bacteroides helcogenes]
MRNLLGFAIPFVTGVLFESNAWAAEDVNFVKEEEMTSQHSDRRHPNVIYIYADDMGIGMLSAYGQRQFTTPNIDRLVKQGTAFSRAYGCMLSAPARASLLTGYHDCHGQDKWNISAGAAYMLPAADTARIASVEARIDASDVCLPEGDLYLPQVFRAAGYATAQIGKLEWGFTATRNQMRRHGWDYYYGYLDHARCHGFYPPFLFDDGSIELIEGNTRINCGKSIEQETVQTFAERRDHTGKNVYSQDIFVDKILNYIRAHKEERFFLYHPSQLPHGPVAIPSVHPELAANPHLTPIEREYGSMVKKLDETVGLILAELEELGIADRTIVVFSADNGHELYYSQKGRCEKPYRNLDTGMLYDDLADKYRSETSGDIFNGNAGMAGLKRSNLEGGVHIPLVFYGPGIIPKGKKSDALVSNYDFLPTMAEWLKVSVQQKDGVSFLPQLLKGKPGNNRRYIIFGSNTGPGIVMGDGWKLRHYLSKQTVELFYLPDDPQEWHDLSKIHPEKVEELKKILLEECGGDLNRGVNRAG